MRTTITLPDDVFISAKKKAVERCTTLGEFITDALRAAICRPVKEHKARTKELPTFRGRGLLPGVHIDSMAELLDAMEGRR